MAFTQTLINQAYNSPTLVALCIAFGYAIGRYHQKRKMRRGGMNFR